MFSLRNPLVRKKKRHKFSDTDRELALMKRRANAQLKKEELELEKEKIELKKMDIQLRKDEKQAEIDDLQDELNPGEESDLFGEMLMQIASPFIHQMAKDKGIDLPVDNLNHNEPVVSEVNLTDEEIAGVLDSRTDKEIKIALQTPEPILRNQLKMSMNLTDDTIDRAIKILNKAK